MDEIVGTVVNKAFTFQSGCTKYTKSEKLAGEVSLSDMGEYTGLTR